jgi:AraC-like DNA-binding protein
MGVLINEFLPAIPLQPFIEKYRQGTFNTLSNAAFGQKVVPHGYLDLIIHLTDSHCDLVYHKEWRHSSDFTMIGLWTEPYRVRFRHKVDVFNIRIKPEGMFELFGIPAAEIANNQADVEEILGKSFIELCAKIREAKVINDKVQLADQYFLKRLESVETDRRYVQMAAALIRDNNFNISIDKLSDEVCISTRQLEREFKKKIGLSPKMYMRIARIKEVHRLLSENMPVNWPSITYSLGYSDQAHFIRDFKMLTGESPTVFLNEKDNFLVS